jgi:hypothetical protein
MGWLEDIAKGFASGVISAVEARQFPALQGQRVQGTQQIESFCSQLGWRVDERVGDRGIVLHFKDTRANTRKVLVTASDAGSIAVLTVFSEAQLAPRRVPLEILGYLLKRNGEMTFPAWQLFANDGNVAFALTYGALVQGLNASTFAFLCETMCNEAFDLDSKLRQAGVL